MTTCGFITDNLTWLQKLNWAFLIVDCFCMHHIFFCANIKLWSIANFTEERHYAKGRIFGRETKSWIEHQQVPISNPSFDKSLSGNCSTINIKPRMVSEKWSLPNSLRRLMMPWSRMMIWWPALLCVCELWFQAIFRPHPIMKW